VESFTAEDAEAVLTGYPRPAELVTLQARKENRYVD
jgi:hypothetical protein